MAPFLLLIVTAAILVLSHYRGPGTRYIVLKIDVNFISHMRQLRLVWTLRYVSTSYFLPLSSVLRNV